MGNIFETETTIRIDCSNASMLYFQFIVIIIIILYYNYVSLTSLETIYFVRNGDNIDITVLSYCIII